MNACSKKFYPVTNLARLAARLAEVGVEAAPLFASIGLRMEDLESPETRVSVEQIIGFLEAVMERVRDPGFAYRVGLQFHATAFGMYGFAILSSPNVRRALCIAARYHRLAVPLAQLSFTERNGEAVWKVEPIAHPRITAALYRFIVEFHLGAFMTMQRDLTGADFRPSRLTLTFDPMPETALAQAPPAATIVAPGPDNSLHFNAAHLDTPTLMGSPLVNQMLIRICDDQLDEQRRRLGLSGRVRAVLIANGLRPMTAPVVARTLGVSERSLRRRLRSESTSVQAICDEVRLQAAVRLLRDHEVPVDDVAEAVGFSDTANFRRAFRRWTGQAPRAFRGGD